VVSLIKEGTLIEGV